MAEDVTVTIGGRAFRIIANGPIRHDRYVTALARRAGVSEITAKPGESSDDLVARVLDRVLVADLSIPIIAALLVPADLALTDWRPETAREIEAFLDTLTAAEDKVVVRGLVAQAIVGFFANGFASLRTSPASSSEPAIVGPSANGANPRPLEPAGV